LDKAFGESDVVAAGGDRARRVGGMKRVEQVGQSRKE
jgi:hypothetical protein